MQTSLRLIKVVYAHNLYVLSKRCLMAFSDYKGFKTTSDDRDTLNISTHTRLKNHVKSIKFLKNEIYKKEYQA